MGLINLCPPGECFLCEHARSEMKRMGVKRDEPHRMSTAEKLAIVLAIHLCVLLPLGLLLTAA